MADDTQRRGPAKGRQDRLKDALRENLKRRKAQARQRSSSSSSEEVPSNIHESALDRAATEKALSSEMGTGSRQDSASQQNDSGDN